ncbi:MAG: cellulose binding domain-containing protein, partial [Pseudomonadota bacterium]
MILNDTLDISVDITKIKKGTAKVKLIIKNIGDETVDGWDLGLDLPYDIKSLKKATLSQAGGLDVLTGTKAIKAGKSLKVSIDLDVGSNSITTAQILQSLSELGSDPATGADGPSQGDGGQGDAGQGDGGQGGGGTSDAAPPLPADVDVQIAVTDSWGEVFNLEIKIVNSGNTAIDGWTVNFALPASIENVWRGNLGADQAGNPSVSDAGWNSKIQPGGEVYFGLTGRLTESNLDPADIEVAFASLSLENGSLVPVGLPPEPGSQPPADQGGGDDAGAASGNVIEVSSNITTEQLQDLVDTAPPGTILQLKAGTFKFTDTLMITRDDITIKGAGIGKTVLKGLDSGSANGRLIYVDGTGGQDIGKVQSDLDVGDTKFTLDRGHSVQVGDKLYIKQESDSDYLDSIGSVDWRHSHSIRNTVAEVVAVNGREITLRDPVGFDYDPGRAEVTLLDLVERVKLSDFTVTYDLGKPNKSSNSNTLGDRYDRSEAITLRGTHEAELANIESINSASTAFHFRTALDLKADNLIANGAHNKGGGGNGYAFELEDVYSSEFSNLRDMDMRHGFTMGSWFSSGNNDIHVAFTNRDVNFHGGRDYNNHVIVDESVADPSNTGEVHTPASFKGS